MSWITSAAQVELMLQLADDKKLGILCIFAHFLLLLDLLVGQTSHSQLASGKCWNSWKTRSWSCSQNPVVSRAFLFNCGTGFSTSNSFAAWNRISNSSFYKHPGYTPCPSTTHHLKGWVTFSMGKGHSTNIQWLIHLTKCQPLARQHSRWSGWALGSCRSSSHNMKTSDFVNMARNALAKTPNMSNMSNMNMYRIIDLLSKSGEGFWIKHRLT